MSEPLAWLPIILVATLILASFRLMDRKHSAWLAVGFLALLPALYWSFGELFT